jgi:hypothetical protein
VGSLAIVGVPVLAVAPLPAVPIALPVQPVRLPGIEVLAVPPELLVDGLRICVVPWVCICGGSGEGEPGVGAAGLPVFWAPAPVLMPGEVEVPGAPAVPVPAVPALDAPPADPALPPAPPPCAKASELAAANVTASKAVESLFRIGRSSVSCLGWMSRANVRMKLQFLMQGRCPVCGEVVGGISASPRAC